MQIDVMVEQFQLADVFTISRGSRTQAQVLTVKISDQGACGYGECVPYARYGESTQSVIDQINGFNGTWDDLPNALPPGAARNALDCAFWDHKAKATGQPVWQLAQLEKPIPQITAYTLSLDTPENMEHCASRHAHRPLLKIKLGTPDDMARLEAVRKGAPKARIIVDANEGWSVDIYTDLAPHLMRLGVEMVEQPLPAHQDDMLAEIERHVPVCADESAHDCATLDGLKNKYDMINIKLDKTGGLTEALALRTAALKAGYDIMVGCMIGSSLAMAPAVLVAQGADVTDLDGPLLLAQDRAEALIYDERGVHPPHPKLWG